MRNMLVGVVMTSESTVATVFATPSNLNSSFDHASAFPEYSAA